MVQGDKRRHLRYDLVDFAVISGEGWDQAYSCIIVDISLGGLQIRSKTPIPVGERCTLKVARLNDRPLEVVGEVRHSAKLEDSGMFASGFRFLPETREERMLIAEYVHEVFLRQSDVAS